MSSVGRIAFFAAFATALAALAEEPRKEAAPDTERKEVAGKASGETIVYVPPSRGATRTRTGGGTRGPGLAPTLAVLAPDHVGVTEREQPTFVWFLSASTGERVDFTLIEEDAVEPLLEVSLPVPIESGIHRTSLADHGARLEEGRSYDWSVALVLDADSRDLDVVAGGAIRRDPPPSGAAAQAPTYRDLAARGIWYDALAELSRAIDESPGDTSLRAARAGLLEQVGVGAAAAFEREKMGHAAGLPSP